MNDEDKLEDLRKRLQKEKEIKAATMKLRDMQQSGPARAACDATLSETQARINYFQNEFDKLQLKKQENAPKAPRTQIAITLPSLANAPPMMKAGLENHLRSYSDTRPPISRRRSSVDWDSPDDFISNRQLTTIGKDAFFLLQLHVALECRPCGPKSQNESWWHQNPHYARHCL
jgi:classical protein kinase C